jgi:hypothetical protein
MSNQSEVTKLSPVHFFSHGSTMMLGEESESADYWKQCGDEALANGVKGVVMMVSEWERISSLVDSLIDACGLGGSLGCTRRRDPSSKQSQAQKIPSRLRSSFQICRL